MDRKDVDRAREFGREAFHRGINAPVLDREFMRHLTNLTSGQEVGASLPLLKEWDKGWTEENLKEKFPGETLRGENSMDIRTANRNPEHPEYKTIPAPVLEGLANYVENGTPTGGFLSKVLENDLMGACNRADLDSRKCLSSLARLIFNHLPAGSYGSPAKVNQWILEKNPEKVPERIDSFFELRRTAERFSDPDKIEPFMNEDAASTIRNIVDAVMDKVDDPLAVAVSDDAARDFFFDQEVWSGEMEGNAFSSSAVFRQVLRRSVETQISEKVTAHVGKVLWVEEEDTAGPGM